MFCTEKVANFFFFTSWYKSFPATLTESNFRYDTPEHPLFSSLAHGGSTVFNEDSSSYLLFIIVSWKVHIIVKLKSSFLASLSVWSLLLSWGVHSEDFYQACAPGVTTSLQVLNRHCISKCSFLSFLKSHDNIFRDPGNRGRISTASSKEWCFML